jgi:hypothetical protein
LSTFKSIVFQEPIFSLNCTLENGLTVRNISSFIYFITDFFNCCGTLPSDPSNFIMLSYFDGLPQRDLSITIQQKSWPNISADNAIIRSYIRLLLYDTWLFISTSRRFTRLSITILNSWLTQYIYFWRSGVTTYVYNDHNTCIMYHNTLEYL